MCVFCFLEGGWVEERWVFLSFLVVINVSVMSDIMMKMFRVLNLW